MNQETGQIAAMASYPTFDNRWFNEWDYMNNVWFRAWQPMLTQYQNWVFDSFFYEGEWECIRDDVGCDIDPTVDDPVYFDVENVPVAAVVIRVGDRTRRDGDPRRRPAVPPSEN